MAISTERNSTKEINKITYNHCIYFPPLRNTFLDLDEEAVDDVLAASWFSHAIHNAGSWTKKAVHDAGDWTKKAAHDVAGAVKKGCGVVNSLPFKELVMRRNEALRKRGISEDQLAAALEGYKGLKQVCHVVG
eukprot:XP_011662144.1 PREDICTED: uncharacterized protein LOC105437349 [Strongylocentrotus purpuratus]